MGTIGCWSLIAWRTFSEVEWCFGDMVPFVCFAPPGGASFSSSKRAWSYEGPISNVPQRLASDSTTEWGVLIFPQLLRSNRLRVSSMVQRALCVYSTCSLLLFLPKMFGSKAMPTNSILLRINANCVVKRWHYINLPPFLGTGRVASAQFPTATFPEPRLNESGGKCPPELSSNYYQMWCLIDLWFLGSRQ